MNLSSSGRQYPCVAAAYIQANETCYHCNKNAPITVPIRATQGQWMADITQLGICFYDKKIMSQNG